MDLLISAVGIEVKPSRGGLRITVVAEGSQAERIGIEPDDLVLGLNGRKVADTEGVNRILSRDFDKETIVLTIQQRTDGLQPAVRLVVRRCAADSPAGDLRFPQARVPAPHYSAAAE